MTDALPRLPARLPSGHKGTFGTAVVVGGCCLKHDAEGRGGSFMIGGPAFSALAALRAGAGLAKLAMPEPILAAGLGVAPSATGVPLPVDHEGDLIPHLAAAAIDELIESALDRGCICAGPGLGVSEGAAALVFRLVNQEQLPLVLDADGLNALAAVPEFLKDFRARAVLTPHPGEYRRLAGALRLTADPLADPARAAEALAQRLGAVVVLKGAATSVSDGQRTWTHDAPNPVLATAGTGDVLAGAIAGLIAQHHGGDADGPRGPSAELGLFDLARLGVAAHSRAARLWADGQSPTLTGGIVATELLALLPRAVESLRL
ncbi:MAG: NAD(P)H-hydrate dehydratase [Phycisphaerales bacterium]|nr:NAD(P)H-hydrate dehydratase [Phycisphaerales bacterium]